MSGPGFEVDAELLGRHAGEFDGLAERASRIVADLRDALSSDGEPWGGDAVGHSFSEAHNGPAADALDRLSGLAGGIGEVGGKFGDAAKAYSSADDGAAGDITGSGG